uniref:Uncharacterized protein n=1 Tax=Anguilla anguilla TaxID=7936 RepID=A0A0E9VBG9_ANGAN
MKGSNLAEVYRVRHNDIHVPFLIFEKTTMGG